MSAKSPRIWISWSLKLLDTRERMQDVPNYAELCRRYLADRQDFSEEKIAEAGILKRYENIDFDACCREIVRDVKIF